VVTASLVLILLSGAARFVDPDVWHSMALAREALASGHVPTTDRFAYTPTVTPVVHHEWASGFLLYFLATHGGIAALQLARAVLVALLVVGAVRVARRCGATPGVLAVLAVPAVMMSWIGLTALRPQLVTLALLAAWLHMLERDRSGRRDWIPLAILAGVVWQNLHGGFVVGIAFLVLYAMEQAMRSRPFAHVLAVAAAMVSLIAVNPYGWSYYTYLGHALTMSRPLIGEWRPIWRAHPVGLAVYLASLTIAVGALARLGPRAARGWLLVTATAYMAARHERHVSIYALTWFAYVPAWVTSTRIGTALSRAWQRPATPVTHAIGLVLAAFAVTLFVSHRPWRLTVPGTTPDGAPMPYPVGPVEYLREQAVAGNVLLPFGVGAFVSWKLAPPIKVSLDTRYESAFPPRLLVEHLDFFAARPGWRETLERYPTDLVLAPAGASVVDVLATQAGWMAVYRDDAYVLFARPGLPLPRRDRRGERLAGTFP
jgi:hypothetical protein